MDSSPLARLPAEIRNQIFEYLVLSDQRLKFSVNERVQLIKRGQIENLLPLTRTCRQLHDEVLPMIYGLNVFRVSTWGTELRNACSVIQNWLDDDLGMDKATMLRKVELELEYSPTEVLQCVDKIARMFSCDGKLELRVYWNVIWMESGYQRYIFPLEMVLRGGVLDERRYLDGVETAASVQRDVLRKRGRGSWEDGKSDLRDLKEARMELMSLPRVLHCEKQKY